MKDKQFINSLYKDAKKLFNYLVDQKEEATKNNDFEEEEKITDYQFALDALIRFTKMKLPKSYTTHCTEKKEIED